MGRATRRTGPILRDTAEKLLVDTGRGKEGKGSECCFIPLVPTSYLYKSRRKAWATDRVVLKGKGLKRRTEVECETREAKGM